MRLEAVAAATCQTSSERAARADQLVNSAGSRGANPQLLQIKTRKDAPSFAFKYKPARPSPLSLPHFTSFPSLPPSASLRQPNVSEPVVFNQHLHGQHEDFKSSAADGSAVTLLE